MKKTVFVVYYSLSGVGNLVYRAFPCLKAVVPTKACKGNSCSVVSGRDTPKEESNVTVYLKMTERTNFYLIQMMVAPCS
jgi:hypothetical protein